MRVLWICNVPNIEATRIYGLPQVNVGGWLTGLSTSISKQDNIELFYSFPKSGINDLLYKDAGLIKYIAIPKGKISVDKYDQSFEVYFSRLKREIKPDIVHVFGTEYSHSLSAVRVFDKNQLVISIQGMTSVYSNHYFSGLPYQILNNRTIFELFKRDNLVDQYKKFKKRGRFENSAISGVKYIIGRTEWDKACTYLINSNSTYFHCDESLRETFYSDNWNLDNIERFSVFITQASSPIKGFHHLLDAVNLLKVKFPNIKIYVSGNNLLYSRKVIGISIETTYTRFIKKKIKKYGLRNNIIFVGSLDETEMKKRFLASNVFVCPSSIENSPNSLGEAMILGVPCISSYVGGVPSLMQHGVEGFMYQYDAPYMLAYYIDRIFSDDNLACQLSKASIKKAQYTHNRLKNAKALTAVYEHMSFLSNSIVHQ